MSALAHAREYNVPQSVTTISANARVDYILRFSKHAVLVVDQDADVYSQVASQFLGSLANDHNAAFIAISPKLNDIQVRCRVIEQLFAGALFDPEQSLAVSLINLAKHEKQAIDIVVKHVQYLSLQILHELCQLTEVARKANYSISVLMVGTPQAGVLLANNKALFNKKISILSGQTGQLLALNAKVFKVSTAFFKFTRFTKWLMVFIGFVVGLALTGFWLFQQDAFSMKTQLGLQNGTLNSTSFVSTTNNELVDSPAQSSDIYLALTLSEQQAQKIQLQVAEVPAEPADIMGAISGFEQAHAIFEATKSTYKEKRFTSYLDEKISTINKVASEPVNKLNTAKATTIEKTVVESEVQQKAVTVKTVETKTADTNKSFSAIEGVGATANYYLQVKTGFVIQIAGFTRLSVYQAFLPDFEKINIQNYHRLLNKQAMLMITSRVYQTRFEAEQAITLLPDAITAHQPWVKSVEAINNEINAYQRSQ